VIPVLQNDMKIPPTVADWKRTTCAAFGEGFPWPECDDPHVETDTTWTLGMMYQKFAALGPKVRWHMCPFSMPAAEWTCC